MFSALLKPFPLSFLTHPAKSILIDKEIERALFSQDKDGKLGGFKGEGKLNLSVSCSERNRAR